MQVALTKEKAKAMGKESIKLTGNQVRVLYFFCFREYVVLTHAFTKTTSKVPEDQIKKALRRRDDVLSRFKKGAALNDSFPR